MDARMDDACRDACASDRCLCASRCTYLLPCAPGTVDEKKTVYVRSASGLRHSTPAPSVGPSGYVCTLIQGTQVSKSHIHKRVRHRFGGRRGEREIGEGGSREREGEGTMQGINCNSTLTRFTAKVRWRSNECGGLRPGVGVALAPAALGRAVAVLSCREGPASALCTWR